VSFIDLSRLRFNKSLKIKHVRVTINLFCLPDSVLSTCYVACYWFCLFSWCGNI